MSYTLQFQLVDTLAATLNSGETTTNLTTGNFGSPTGTQLYVVDYDVPGSAEIISATIAGTAVTSITRGLSGGAAGTTNHAVGAKIGAFFVPQHYAALTDGSGFQTGTSSIGIPASAIKQEAWTSYTPTWTASVGSPAIGNGTLSGSYIRSGNMVYYTVYLLAGSTTTYGTSGSYSFSLPVTAKNNIVSYIGSAYLLDNGTSHYSAIVRVIAGGSTAGLYVVGSQQVGVTIPFTFANGDRLEFTIVYEAA